MQVNSITHFRAIAIFFVVSSHVLVLARLPHEHPVYGFIWKILPGGTTFFIVISGFLFHRVFARRFDFRRFMTGKLRNVLQPYLTLTLVTAPLVLLLNGAWFTDYFDRPLVTIPALGLLDPLMFLLLTGDHIAAHWYIPFVMLLFLMAPLHMAFIRAPLWLRLSLTGALFVLSLWIHRPLTNADKLHCLLYYTSAYLIGILASQHWDLLQRHLPRLGGGLVAIGVMIAALDASYGAATDHYVSALSLRYHGIDWMMLQKIVLSFGILGLCMRLEHRDIPALRAIADCSFGIFFVHGIYLYLVERSGLFDPHTLPFTGDAYGLNLVFWFTTIFALSYLTTRLAQQALGARSRRLIGS